MQPDPPNAAVIVNLIDDNPVDVPDSNNISFKLRLDDQYNNPTNILPSGQNAFRIRCCVANSDGEYDYEPDTFHGLKVEGLAGEYGVSTDGIIEVTGLRVLGVGDEAGTERDFWIAVMGIGDVMFQIKLVAGEPPLPA